MTDMHARGTPDDPTDATGAGRTPENAAIATGTAEGTTLTPTAGPEDDAMMLVLEPVPTEQDEVSAAEATAVADAAGDRDAAAEPVILELTPVEIVWRDDRTGRTLLRGELPEGGMVTMLADLVEVELGTPRRFWGDWRRHPRFGPRFEAWSEVDPELDVRLAEHYLASGVVPHVGPSTAAAIADTFGAETLTVMMEDPRALLSVRGITEPRLPALRRGLRETVHLAPVIGLLDPVGISLGTCKRVYRRYGASAVSRINADPWRLARDIRGIGFLTADKVARSLGVPFDSPHRLDAAIIEALRRAASDEGHTLLAEPVLLAAAAGLIGHGPEALRARLAILEADGEIERVAAPPGWALPRLVRAEELIAAKVRLLASWNDPDPLTVSDAQVDRLQVSEGIAFDESQRRAIRGALTERVTVITGGPGTGKTTIVRAILDIAQERGWVLALASPTGRAAKRLSEATGRPAQTVHRWLRYKPSEGFAGPAQLPDLVVIDEASMLDVPLAARVFAALPPYAHLLLVGDIDQLPAIGPGNVLGDLIACPHVGVYRLRTIHRQAAGSAVPQLASQILAEVRKPDFDGVTTRMIEREEAQDVADYIIKAIERQADEAADIQVIAPMRKGACGTDALNRGLQAVLNPAIEGERAIRRSGMDLRVGDRVIVTDNDYDNDLFNGDIGYLRAIGEDGTFTFELDGELRELPADAANGLTLAYAMTVHRAQGSEFPVVILPMHPSAYMLLERRLLYTAVSRARRTLAIVGQKKAVAIAVSKHDPNGRNTRLRAALLEPRFAPSGTDAVGQDEAAFAASTGSALLADPDFDF